MLPLPPPEEPIDSIDADLGVGSDTISSREIDSRVRDAGGASGNLRVSLAWSTIDDLDLAIIQPNGVMINYEPANSVDPTTGGAHDVDRNREGSRVTREPVENIYWTNPLPGSYRILVNYYDHFSSDSSVPFVVNCVQGEAVIEVFRGKVFTKGQTMAFDFDFQP